MPRETKTVRVAEVQGHTMIFDVESWTAPQKPHRVDLLAHGGIGECSCTDWSTRRWPAIRDKKTTGLHCRHVTAARLYFLNKLLRHMAQDHHTPKSAHA